jgi:hypothetical protein
MLVARAAGTAAFNFLSDAKALVQQFDVPDTPDFALDKVDCFR